MDNELEIIINGECIILSGYGTLLTFHEVVLLYNAHQPMGKKLWAILG